MNYSFGIPGQLIWSVHIIIGLLLALLGYALLNQWEIPQLISIGLIVLGTTAAFYHLHLWWINDSNVHNVMPSS